MIGLRKEVGPDVLSPQSPYPLSEIYHTDFFMAGAWAWPLALSLARMEWNCSQSLFPFPNSCYRHILV